MKKQDINWKIAAISTTIGYFFAALINYHKGVSLGSEMNFVIAIATTGFWVIFNALLLQPQMLIGWLFPIFVIVFISNGSRTNMRWKNSVALKKDLIVSLLQALKILGWSLLLYMVVLVVLYGLGGGA